MWVNPIIDRTQSDIDYMIYLTDKIKTLGFDGLTDEEEWFWFSGSQEEIFVTIDSTYETLLDSDGIQIVCSDNIIRGSLNINDLNRIENNTVYLHNILESHGYSVTITTHSDWVMSDLVYLTDIDRIKQNLLNLINGYYSLSTTPILTLGDYELDAFDINDIEQNLYDINYLLLLMIDSFRYSGTFYSGEGIIL